MKKNKYNKSLLLLFASFFAFGIFFSSCEKDVLDLVPYNQISENVAFDTPEKIALAVNGMYEAAQVGQYRLPTGDGLRGYPFGAAFVQQGDNRGEDVVNTQAFYQITYMGTYNSTTANNVFYWNDTYRLINLINIVAEGVQKAGEEGIISVEQANEYLGEALLLRAASYHELLIHFARDRKSVV